MVAMERFKVIGGGSILSDLKRRDAMGQFSRGIPVRSYKV